MSDEHPGTQVTLDDAEVRRAALADPGGFIAGFETPALIDEVQRGGSDLLLALKAEVDRNASPGRFLLTGSSDPLASRCTSDTLTGRIERIRLWPLSQAELHCASGNLVDRLFEGAPPSLEGTTPGRDAFIEPVLAGGYPEVIERTARRRRAWFDSYVEGVGTSGDLEELSYARHLEELPRMLRILAASSAELIVYSRIGRQLGLDHKTVKAYVRLLEISHLVKVVRPWRPSRAAREAAAPKVHVVDSGLLAHLLSADSSLVANDDQVTGRCLESFVAMEIARLLERADVAADLFHYRAQAEEVDLVLEAWSGTVVGIEVKARTSLSERDWRSLAKLRDRLDDRFAAGVVIHPGRGTLPLGDRLWALPVEALWRSG